MYKTDDIIFFGSTGVCRVVSVGEPSIAGMPSGVDYYTLQPLSQSHREMIYVLQTQRRYSCYNHPSAGSGLYISHKRY